MGEVETLFETRVALMRKHGSRVAIFPDGMRIELGDEPDSTKVTLPTDATHARQRREELEAERRRVMFAAVGGPVRRASQ